MKSKGFTLIELIAVIVVLAIVFSILVPSFINYVKDANVKGMQDLETTLEEGAKDYNIKTGNEIPSSEDKNIVISATTLQSEGILTDFTDKCDIEKTYVVATYCGKNKIGYKAYLKCNSYETKDYQENSAAAEGSCKKWDID